MAISHFLKETFVRRQEDSGLPVDEVNVDDESHSDDEPTRLSFEQNLVMNTNRMVGAIFVGSFVYLAVISFTTGHPSSLIENAFSGTLGFFLSTMASYVQRSRPASHPKPKQARTAKGRK